MKALRINLFFMTILLTFTMFMGCERGNPPLVPQGSTLNAEPIVVMTYNVYLGSSLQGVLSIEDIGDVLTAVSDVYDNVIASDFPRRAAAIAESVKAAQPHIIGLQEVSLIRRQTPGDRFLNGTIPAEEVVLDYLQLLMDALQAQGLNYQVAGKVENIDVEMPLLTDTGIDDVRLTDYDVILVRDDVTVSNSISANYSDAFTIENLGLDIKRGYVAVNATVANTTYRVVNTHLAAFSETVRIAQTEELIDTLRAETLPMFLLGDFNTPAPDGTAYKRLNAAGYIDVWQTDTQETGDTCCQAANLQNHISSHSRRIDYIFIRNMEHPLHILTRTVGDQQSERLPSETLSSSDLWPSDHAGVVARIAFE